MAGRGGMAAGDGEMALREGFVKGGDQVLQAVLFDLDGTLLQLETGEFTAEYLKEISRAAASVVDPGRFTEALLASTGVMRANRDPSVTNARAFWADFRRRLEDCIEELEPVIQDFYATRFNSLSRVARPCPGARAAVQAAVDRGLRIVLATNPVFPLSAIRDRMSWAGVEDLPWEFVTCYEEMHFCKPHPGYYREIAGRLGLPAEVCLMAGNDAEEDLAAARIGMKTYLVTDFMKGPVREEFNPDWIGSLEDLAWWLAAGPWTV